MSTAEVEKYPEHARLAKVKEKSQACGEFLDWLLGERGYVLGEYHEHGEECEPKGRRAYASCGMVEEVLYPASLNAKKLLAEFFEIDEEMLEFEKERMLEELRSADACIRERDGDGGE